MAPYPIESGAAVPHQLAVDALDRAVYLLDRGFTEPRKVAAFVRARAAVAALTAVEFDQHLASGTLTNLAGVGASSERVVLEAIAELPDSATSYLGDLDEKTRLRAGPGADLRSKLRGDLHTHSTWSDGGASIEAMAAAAAAIGHRYLVVTDHSPRLTVAHGLSPERLAAQREEIRGINERQEDIRVLSGVEVDILLDGALDLPDDILGELDLVVASVHSKLSMERTEMTDRMLAAVAHPSVAVLGHLTGRKIVGRGRAPSTFDVDAVLTACARHDTAVEINCRPERMDPPDEILVRAFELGCSFAIDSDAHAPGQLEWVTIGCKRAAAAGIPAERILNCREDPRPQRLSEPSRLGESPADR